MPVPVLIADDHPLVRLGLRSVLTSETDFTVVGETGDGRDVLPLVQRLVPRVLLLDVMMP